MTIYLRIFFLVIVISACSTGNKSKYSTSDELAFTIKEQGVMCSTAVTDIEWYLSQSRAPILEGMDILNYPITTSHPEAQQYFNQGLLLAYGFNHAEAARSFYEATRIDSTCAMCHWGFAYVLGPNYNAGMEPDNYDRAYRAIVKAKQYSYLATKKEQALIDALTTRYAAIPPEDRSSLDQAYSEALKVIHARYPDDPEIAAMYAESLMNLHPWDLYDNVGVPKPWTPEILTALKKTIDLQPNHPGAHHFYIHAVEASANPEMAYASAKIFDDGLVPGSGHLIHMPSHIYIRTGDYHKGTLANIRAVAADSSYLSQCHAQGAYPLGYYPHNMHFIAACAMYAGNSHWAAIGANAVSDHASRQIMKEDGWGTLQHYYSMPYYVAVKFGKWEDILGMTNFDPEMKYPEAVRHFARGMAFLGQSQNEKAHEELRALETFATDESLKEVSIWGINNTYTLLQIAHRVLKAELLAREKNYEESIALLQEAVEIEDELQYQEPTDWLLSVRHHLGAVFIEAGQFEEAIEVYKQDLIKLPRNGWAQHGLKAAYEAIGQKDQQLKIENELEESWSVADIEIKGSRIL